MEANLAILWPRFQSTYCNASFTTYNDDTYFNITLTGF